LKITRKDIEQYLKDVFEAVNEGRYSISPRQKNFEMYIDYKFSREDAKKIILSLTPCDFSDAVPNEHPRYSDEILYIFGKDVELVPNYSESLKTVSLYIKFNKLENNYLIVISLHEQEHPLTYKFK